MKKVLLTTVAALAVLSAAAQDVETKSTVKGGKLNFEAPLFGITEKNMIPKWSLVAFGGVFGGYSYRFKAPSQMNASGYYGELNLIELRYRPWRDGNLFSWGITTSVERHPLEKGYSFNDHGDIVSTPESWLSSNASSIEEVLSLDIGYTREWGNWKAGVFLSPGTGYSVCLNSYRPGRAVPANGLWYGDYTPAEGEKVIYWSDKANRMTTNLSGNYGFRLGVKAGLWYNNVGITAGYNFAGGVGPTSSWNRYDSFHVGVTVRY